MVIKQTASKAYAPLFLRSGRGVMREKRSVALRQAGRAFCLNEARGGYMQFALGLGDIVTQVLKCHPAVRLSCKILSTIPRRTAENLGARARPFNFAGKLNPVVCMCSGNRCMQD